MYQKHVLQEVSTKSLQIPIITSINGLICFKDFFKMTKDTMLINKIHDLNKYMKIGKGWIGAVKDTFK